DYWYGPRFDQVEDLSPDIAAELCDTGVNMGPTVASRMLQRWLNVFNLRGKLYPDMDADGRIGPRTLNALRAYLKNRSRDGELVLVKALNCTQGERYLELAEKREASESFVYGWMKERVAV
ncbi:putative peptidoglycan-binding domain-containing protein, partial [Escherichia coli]